MLVTVEILDHLELHAGVLLETATRVLMSSFVRSLRRFGSGHLTVNVIRFCEHEDLTSESTGPPQFRETTVELPNNTMIEIKCVTKDSELEAIQALQRANLRKNLSEPEAAKEGFLIAEYSLDFLRRMHESHPSVIAVDGDQLVGYALVTTKTARDGHSLLDDLCTHIDRLTYKNRPLKNAKYVLVGQLCVDKCHRGKGLVQQMYGLFRESLQSHYDYGITDVARANQRSLQAHLKTGFQVIHSIQFEGLEWDVILWDWTRKSP